MPRRIVFMFSFLVLVIAAGPLLLRSGTESPAPPAVEELVAAIGSQSAPDTVSAPVPSEVELLLRTGRPWRAARRMQEYLQSQPDAPPLARLIAARAEAGWGGWENIRALLEGRPWLGTLEAGEGWFWLARSLEEEERWDAALQAYESYLSAPDATADQNRRLVAEVRRDLLLLRTGQREAGAAALARVRERAPDIAPRLGILAAEALAESGDTAGVRALIEDVDESTELQLRGRHAYVKAYREVGDDRGARELALRYRASADDSSDRAAFLLSAARAALALGDGAAARSELREIVTEVQGSRAAREAAAELTDLGGLSAAEELAIARVYDRHGNDRRAVSGYRAWLRSGTGSADQRRDVQLRLGRALFALGEYAEAERALAELAGGSSDEAAEALYITARSRYRRGQTTEGRRTFMQVAERFPRSKQAADGLFLVADLAHDAGEVEAARGGYRRVLSEHRDSDRAELALMRLSGQAFLEGRYAAAANAWDDYRETFPRGSYWLQASYWAGRAYEEAGNDAVARERYRAVRSREPLSYYSLRASERLGESFWPVPLDSSPAEDPAARQRIEEWLRGDRPAAGGGPVRGSGSRDRSLDPSRGARIRACSTPSPRR